MLPKSQIIGSLLPFALFRIVDSALSLSFWLSVLGNQLDMRAKARRL
jgi:hypothetical protein